MLYGILVYQSCKVSQKLQFRKSVWTRRETAFIIHFTQQIIRVLVFIGPASQVFCIRRSEDSDRQLIFIQAAVRSGIFIPKD